MAIEAEALRNAVIAIISEGRRYGRDSHDIADEVLALIHRSALAEDTARAAEGWEPIETVLLGEPVLTYGGKSSLGGKPCGHRTLIIDELADLFRDDGSPFPWSPTHWRPLPAPPALPLDKDAADANR